MLQYYFFILSTTPNIHPRLDSRIEPKFFDWKRVMVALLVVVTCVCARVRACVRVCVFVCV